MHVVSLYADEYYEATPNLRTSLEVIMFDSVGQNLSDIDRIARWALECLEEGPTLLHCHMGLNRSGVVVARILMLQGMSAEEAIALERERRSPACLNNPAFEQWLLDNPVTPEEVP
jgi:protein-tyrosine phosphatase